MKHNTEGKRGINRFKKIGDPAMDFVRLSCPVMDMRRGNDATRNADDM